MKYCPKCGWELKDGQSFCSNCGTPVNEQYVDAQPNKIGKTKRIIITVLLVFALLGIFSNAFDCFEVSTALSEDGVTALKQMLEENPSLQLNFNGVDVEQLTDTELAQFTEILRIIMTAFGICALVPLCWAIPMTIKILKAMKNGTVLKTGFKICTLIFVNLIVGIVLLCSNDI